jgi:hypothetical protein
MPLTGGRHIRRKRCFPGHFSYVSGRLPDTSCVGLIATVIDAEVRNGAACGGSSQGTIPAHAWRRNEAADLPFPHSAREGKVVKTAAATWAGVRSSVSSVRVCQSA